jgi:hypothetical protein
MRAATGDAHDSAAKHEDADKAQLDTLQKLQELIEKSTNFSLKLSSALDGVTRDLHDRIASISTFGTGFTSSDEDAPFGHGSGGAGRASGSGVGGNVTYNINVAAPNPGETGRQFAMRAFPMIRDAQRRDADQAAGEAMVAMAQRSMGGGIA